MTAATLDAMAMDLLITDDVDRLFDLRQTLKTPILLVTAYGNFLPSEQSAALAPLHQLARPLARSVAAPDGPRGRSQRSGTLRTEASRPGDLRVTRRAAHWELLSQTLYFCRSPFMIRSPNVPNG